MKFTHRKKMGFSGAHLYRAREPGAMHYLTQNMSFWIATFSVFAFVAGNMVGQHGWYAFWKSVLGGYDDSLIVYDGTVPPLEYIPDFQKWASFGGNHKVHTYSQIPQDARRKLPLYDSAKQRRTDIVHGAGNDPFVMGWLSPYTTGVELKGVHAGVDIRTATKTPLRSIANGIVAKVGYQNAGAGKYVVVRHPHMPDPDDPKNKTTVLYASYLHLSSIFVSEGDIVTKGQHIADTGNSGFSTGPHVEFQLTRVPGPYSAFTSAEARRKGLSFTEAVNSGLNQDKALKDTVNPLVYAQANYDPVGMPDTTIVEGEVGDENTHAAAPRRRARGERRAPPAPPPSEPERPVRKSASQLRAERLASIQSRIESRMRSRRSRNVFAARSRGVTTLKRVSDPVPEKPVETVTLESVGDIVVSTDVSTSIAKEKVASVRISHDREYSGRSWEKLTVTLYNSAGEKIRNPDIERYLQVQSANNKRVEFRPKTLTASDFKDGEATVHALVFGTKGAIVYKVHGFEYLSDPMVYKRATR